MFSIDSRSRVPIYEQLKHNIISLVSSGGLVPDDQLPSVRSLARELGVNPNTVQKAYQELETQGFIYQAMGRGSFISPCEELTKSLTVRHLDELKQTLLHAKQSGVSGREVLTVVKAVFNGEELA